MRVNNSNILNTNYRDIGEVVSLTNGGETLDDASCLVTLKTHPNDDHETRTLKTIIWHQVEQIRYLKKALKQQ